MRNPIVIFVLIAVMLLGSCSKEKLEQTAVEAGLAIMTDGSWIITKYSEGTNNITTTFSGWECKFNTDKTAVASKGASIVSGTWSASITNKTISSQFPAGSGVLDKLNGTWKIVKNNTTYAEFTQAINGVECTMELTKK